MLLQGYLASMACLEPIRPLRRNAKQGLNLDGANRVRLQHGAFTIIQRTSTATDPGESGDDVRNENLEVRASGEGMDTS